jgi:hypothetical protein
MSVGSQAMGHGDHAAQNSVPLKVSLTIENNPDSDANARLHLIDYHGERHLERHKLLGGVITLAHGLPPESFGKEALYTPR